MTAQETITTTPKSTARLHRRFARRYVVVFTLLTFLGVAVNIFEFPGTSERGWKTRRLDERAGTLAAPDVFILGSSRTMQIRPEYVQAITGGVAFNYGVSSAQPMDFYAQLHYLDHLHYKPRAVLIGVDETAFNDIPASHVSDKLLAHPGLFAQLPVREQGALLLSVMNTISLQSTSEDIGRIFKSRSAFQKNTSDAEDVLLDNGYIIFASHELEQKAGRFKLGTGVNSKIFDFNANKTRYGDAYFRLSERKLDLFAQSLDLARAHGADVRVVLLPMHPDMIASQTDGKLAHYQDELSARLAKICADKGCVFRDYRSVDRFGGDPNGFWDGLHLTPENLRRMTNAIYDLPADKVVVDIPPDLQTLEHLPKVTTLSTY